MSQRRYERANKRRAGRRRDLQKEEKKGRSGHEGAGGNLYLSGLSITAVMLNTLASSRGAH